MSTFLRQLSKSEWTDGGKPTTEYINAGSFQRIADAAEKMATRHTELIDNLESTKRNRDFWLSKALTLERSVSALRGVITKLKNRNK